MPDRTLKLKELRRILAAHSVQEDSSRGKGSHTLFWKVIDGNRVSFPVPTSRRGILECYVKGCRKRFRLTVQDGVSDRQFYIDGKPPVDTP